MHCDVFLGAVDAYLVVQFDDIIEGNRRWRVVFRIVPGKGGESGNTLNFTLMSLHYHNFRRWQSRLPTLEASSPITNEWAITSYWLFKWTGLLCISCPEPSYFAFQRQSRLRFPHQVASTSIYIIKLSDNCAANNKIHGPISFANSSRKTFFNEMQSIIECTFLLDKMKFAVEKSLFSDICLGKIFCNWLDTAFFCDLKWVHQLHWQRAM